jgi:hypothetical protein
MVRLRTGAIGRVLGRPASSSTKIIPAQGDDCPDLVEVI